MVYLRKLLFFLFVVLISITVIGCGGGGGSSEDDNYYQIAGVDDTDTTTMSYTTLTVGTPLNDSVLTSKYYRVYFSTTGLYTISLTDQSYNSSLTFYTYDHEDSNSYDLVDNKVFSFMIYADDPDEPVKFEVTSIGYIYVQIFNWHGGGYTNFYKISIDEAAKSED